MTGLQDAPPLVHRAIVVGVASYFLLVLYHTTTGSVPAWLLSNVLFALLAIGLGAVLYWESTRELDAITVAATCLVVGGVTQLLWLVTDILALDVLASATVFAGIGLYIYAIYTQ